MATKTTITAKGCPYRTGANSPKIGDKIAFDFMKNGKYPATKTECGKALKIKAIIKIQNAMELSFLARPYPARVPNVNEIITTPEVTINEFLKKREKPLSVQTA